MTDKIIDNFTNTLQEELAGPLFSARKPTDIPTDPYQAVNRKYVTLNGATNTRPISSIIGQFYLDTQINKALWWNGIGWMDSLGNYH
jgi:hypothetical protein